MLNSIKGAIAPSLQHFRQDLLASIVVFLVALPLCMGIAIASGVPPALGIVTGIIGGLVVGAIAGAPLQVSGPAAGLTVLVYETVHAHGLGMLGVVVLVAGLLQIAAGALKLGQWFRAVSPAVVHGMLAGIGVLIIASQIHVVVDAAPRGSGLANLASIPEALYKGVVPMDGTSHHLAAAIGLLTIGLMVAWKYVPRWMKSLPAPLVAVAVATGVAFAFKLPINYVEVPDSLWGSMNWPSLASLGRVLEGPILIAAASFALIASAETLLATTAVDQMHRGPRANYDRELLAQGVGNSICGVFGALPLTGVIVRSTANVEAGAKTRLSAMMHGLWLLGLVVALPFTLRLIPTTALAAMLVFTGFKLLTPKAAKELARFGKSEVAIYVATIVAIVATNLLEGVLIGLALSVAKLLYALSHLESRLDIDHEQHVALLHLKGAATFLGVPRLAATLAQVPPNAELHVEVEELDYIDHACLDLLYAWEKQHAVTGGKLTIEWAALHRRYHDQRPSSRMETLAGEAKPR